MPKETFYFSHDFGARNDPKLINLQIKWGMVGVGCYWCIVEMLYEQGGMLPLEYDRISFVLRTNENIIRSIINDFKLFSIKDEMFTSNSVLNRIEIRNGKSVKARESVNKRWHKSEIDTNVPKTDTNVPKDDTIKESKVNKRKESKVNNNSDFDLSFIDSDFEDCFLRWLKYKKDIKDFYKSQDSIHQAYKNLLKLSDNNFLIAEEIISASIGNGYKGLFPLKQNKASPEISPVIKLKNDMDIALERALINIAKEEEDERNY